MPAASAFVMEHVFSHKAADQEEDDVRLPGSSKRFKSWNKSHESEPEFGGSSDSPSHSPPAVHHHSLPSSPPPPLSPQAPPHDPLLLGNHYNEEEDVVLLDGGKDNEWPDDDDDDDEELAAVKEVTEGMLIRLEQEEWEHVNGVYDSSNEWRTWDQPVTLSNDFDDSTFVILPYIDIT